MSANAFLDAVRGVVRKELVEEPARPDEVILQERDPGASRMRTKIWLRADTSLVLRLDQCDAVTRGMAVPDRLFPLHRSDKGLWANCDYVILCERGDTVHLLLIELKSRNASGAFDQILNTRLLIDGLLAAARLHRLKEIPCQVRCRGVILTASAKRSKGNCPYDKSDPRMPDLRAVILPADEEYRIHYLCP